jgi:hypothetical protein
MISNKEQIWDTITDSAKEKFDYPAFEKMFADNDIILAENILFKVITDYASKKTKSKICNEIFTELLTAGIQWEIEEINKFIDDKEELLKLEINLTLFASAMLQEENDLDLIMNNIDQFIKK